MGDQNKTDTRKAAMDLAGFLAKEQIPPVHVILLAFQLRYGFTKSKLKTLLEAYPAYELDEENDRIIKVGA